jgi:hypothetical protein
MAYSTDCALDWCVWSIHTKQSRLCVLTEEESSPWACSTTARLLLHHAGLLWGPASALTGRCDVLNGFDASRGAFESIMARCRADRWGEVCLLNGMRCS